MVCDALSIRPDVSCIIELHVKINFFALLFNVTTDYSLRTLLHLFLVPTSQETYSCDCMNQFKVH